MSNKTTNQKEYSGLPKNSLIYKTNREDRWTSKNTIKSYEDAKTDAQGIDRPNRYRLLELYKDIVEDSHLKSVLTQRKSRISGLPFTIVNTNNDKVNDKVTDLFNDSWFNKFINYAMDGIFYGNSLIELNNLNGEVDVTLIPRENVIPEFKEVKINPWDYEGAIDYTQPAYNNLIDINNDNNPRNLGELLNLTKLVLIKSEVMLNYAQYIEIYGQPLRIGITDSQDQGEINRIAEELHLLGRSASMVMNSQTEVQFQDGSSSSQSDLFDDLIERINSEISKHILGVTMLSDDGSSRSQSEVHQNASYLITKSDIRNMEYLVNSLLIPKLKKYGLITAKNIEFKFNEIEMLTVDEKLQIDQFLLDNFELRDIKYYEDRWGVEITDYKKWEPENEETDEEETDETDKEE